LPSEESQSISIRCPEQGALWRQEVSEWLPGVGMMCGLGADR
jgi:hypothetical protein